MPAFVTASTAPMLHFLAVPVTVEGHTAKEVHALASIVHDPPLEAIIMPVV